MTDDTTTIASKRIAIIGAGPSGLAQLRAFQSASAKGLAIPKRIVCFEKQSNWGGLWNYSWRTGCDEFGEPVHNGMYRYLWSNGPKEGLEFADYTFEEHFNGNNIPSYPPREVLWDYIQGRAQKADIRKYIQFNTVVRRVDYDETTGTFCVLSEQLQLPTSTTTTNGDNGSNGTKKVESKEYFDHVIVASGHFSTPNVPEYPGFQKIFEGRILHAHDFRDAREFQNQNILIVGSSYSAEDIASQCWKYGCNHITISHRHVGTTMGLKWPSAAFTEIASPIAKVDKTTVTFENGQTAENIQSIILCTGYQHSFPFMAPELRLVTTNRLAIADLYKGVVFVPNTKLFYLGMQDQWYTFNMFDAQAWYVRDLIFGKIEIPSNVAKLQEDVQDRIQREDNDNKDDYDCIRYQGKYIQELIQDTDYPQWNIEAANEAFFLWKKHKKQDIMTFRDHGGYISPMTGAVSPPHHTPWKDALDDSLESFLSSSKKET